MYSSYAGTVTKRFIPAEQPVVLTSSVENMLKISVNGVSIELPKFPVSDVSIESPKVLVHDVSIQSLQSKNSSNSSVSVPGVNTVHIPKLVIDFDAMDSSESSKRA